MHNVRLQFSLTSIRKLPVFWRESEFMEDWYAWQLVLKISGLMLKAVFQISCVPASSHTLRDAHKTLSLRAGYQVFAIFRSFLSLVHKFRHAEGF